ncbi:separin [Contarinia nasturtii]|uniref:separin n=1 Tax=Contarinia nasturtii TaxID=265458 RepID=UPI0012D3DDD3|nr:separin [Contarinia nasturtii]
MDSGKKESNDSPDLNSNISSTNSIDDKLWQWKPWSIRRNEYQRTAYKADQSGDFEKAILYDSKALSCGFVGTFLNENRAAEGNENELISQTIDLQQKTGNVLIDYLSEYLENVVINDTTIEPAPATDDQTQFNDLHTKCAQLPKEWNVIQLSQLYNGYNRYATKRDMYTSDAPIRITLFRDSVSEKRDNRPTNIILDWLEFGEESILSTSYKVHEVLYENYTSHMNTENYSSFMKELKTAQSKLVDDMISWLGPWITLLSGKIKGKDGENFEKKLFEDVEIFGKSQKFTNDQITYLSLMARRIDLLENDDCEQAGRFIARNFAECTQIKNFLIDLKNKTTIEDFEYYPCILVIDEILDPLPWEMCLTSQEFTRMHSIYFLFDLYERYKDQINDGYLKIDVKNGLAMINPNDDEKLAHMCERMSSYYKDFLPKWKRIEKEVPSPEQFTKCLTENDVFVYSGHGSSLQFFATHEFENIKQNCIMMLFGCESIAMQPRGTVCEATCQSYVYFKNGCPALLGALTIVTDVWVDLITICILTQWVVPMQEKHPTIEICKDERSKEHIRKILLKSEGKRNPNLLALLCEIRNESSISFGIRSAMVFRGLPPYNTSMEK